MGFKSSSKCSIHHPMTSSVDVNGVPSLLCTAVLSLVVSPFPLPEGPDGVPEALWWHPKVLLHSMTEFLSQPLLTLSYSHVCWSFSTSPSSGGGFPDHRGPPRCPGLRPLEASRTLRSQHTAEKKKAFYIARAGSMPPVMTVFSTSVREELKALFHNTKI